MSADKSRYQVINKENMLFGWEKKVWRDDNCVSVILFLFKDKACIIIAF